MNKQLLQQEILSCVWSKDLKNYVAAHSYEFSGMDLLSIAHQYAPTFSERLRLLQLLADHAPEVSEFAARCIRFQNDCFEQFCRQGEHEVYELRIKDEPDAYEERYLCASYQTALDMIDGFYQEYECAPDEKTARYVITKRRILQPADAFQEDELQECILGAGKVLVSAELWSQGFDPKREITLVVFPGFIPNLSAVRYRQSDNTIGRGVCLSDGDSPAEAFYVIPLDNEFLKNRDYENHVGHHWHEHIPGPDVEVMPVEDLSEEEKDTYFAFVQYCKEEENA